MTPRYTIHVSQDDTPVRGNALASGDDANDRECEDEILARLNDGDVWAWACVEVRAHRGDFHASSYLGACSYANEADFRADDYFGSMCMEALELLDEKLREATRDQTK